MTTTDIWLIDFACHDPSCRPPTAGGTGGSKGGPSRGHLSPTPQTRLREPQGRSLESITDEEVLAAFSGIERPGLALIVKIGFRDKNVIEVNGHFFNADGERDGDMARRIRRGDDGKLYVEHLSLIVPKAHQGQGLAQEVNDKALDFYQKIGVDRIELRAGLQTGPYAWATQGYRVRGNEQERREFIGDRLRAVRVKVDKLVEDGKATPEEGVELKRRATELLNASNRGEDVQPIHVASIGQGDPSFTWKSSGHEMWPGKAVLVKDMSKYGVEESQGSTGRTLTHHSDDRGRNWDGVYYLEGAKNP